MSLRDLAIEHVVAGGVAVLGFLVKHYFSSLVKGVAEIKLELAKRDGQLELLQKEIHSNTVQLAGVCSELKAVWRFVDNAPKRATDLNGAQ